MSKPLGILVLLAAAVAALFAVLGRDGAPRRADELAAPGARERVEPARETADLRELAPDPEGRAAAAPERAAAPAPVPAPVPDDEPEDGRPRVRGRVLGMDGTPMAGFDVRDRGGDAGPLATTGPLGAFSFPLADPERLVLHADREGWVTVRLSVVDRWTLGREHVVVVSPAVDLAGRAVDEAGLSVGSARLLVELGDEHFSRFPLPLDLTERRRFDAVADAEGRFELLGVPSAPEAELVARAPGHEPEGRDVPDASDRGLVVELTRVDPGDAEPAIVAGTVLLPDHRPAAGADVAFGSARTRSDAAGGFEIALDGLYGYDDGSPLVAALDGLGPAVLPRYGERLRERSAALTPEGAEGPAGTVDVAQLVLGEAGLELRGRVADAEGEPLAGWKVALDDPTEISRQRVPPVVAEALARDGTKATTDDRGRFALTGLLLRTYRLRAHDPETLLQVLSDPVLAGRGDVEIVVPDGLLHPRLEGRVVSRRGEPVAGAAVGVGLVTHESGGGVSWTSLPSVATDEDGGFVLERVPRRHAHLDVRGEDVVPTRHAIPEQASGELVLEVPRRCHFRVEVVGERPDVLRVRVLDADGAALPITTFHASGSSSSPSRELSAGGTMPVCAVSEDARTVALDTVLEDGATEELARREIVLDPGRVGEIRFELP